MSSLLATSPLTNTVQPLNGGADAYSGIGMNYLIDCLGPFNTGDQITLNLTDNLTGLLTQVGAGYATGKVLTYCLVFGRKIYAAAGPDLFFCASDDPTTWNDPNRGSNGYKDMSNSFTVAQDIKALGSYQGKLCVIGRNETIIESVNADPSLNADVQILPNIGTFAPESVRGLGDMDLIMLYDSGFRSVRVRDASNNAIINDVGVPIDSTIKTALAGLSDAQKAAACGHVDPSANRYLCYIPNADGSAGTIYNYSYFTMATIVPTAEIAAWGTYTTKYEEAVTASSGSYDGSGHVTYTVTNGHTYYWDKQAHETSITDGTTTLTDSGFITAVGTTLTATGTASATVTAAVYDILTFVPTRFQVLNGRVYARAGDDVFCLGGSDGATYDSTQLIFITPYLDSQLPASRKQFKGVDVIMQGSFKVYGDFDYTVNSYKKLLYNNSSSSPILRNIGWDTTGTHYSFKAVSFGRGYCKFARIIPHVHGVAEK